MWVFYGAQNHLRVVCTDDWQVHAAGIAHDPAVFMQTGGIMLNGLSFYLKFIFCSVLIP